MINKVSCISVYFKFNIKLFTTTVENHKDVEINTLEEALEGNYKVKTN